MSNLRQEDRTGVNSATIRARPLTLSLFSRVVVRRGLEAERITPGASLSFWGSLVAVISGRAP